MEQLGKIPYTVLKVFIKINIFAVSLSLIFSLFTFIFVYQTANANLALFDKALSTMNYIEEDIAVTFMGSRSLVYNPHTPSVFSNIVDTLPNNYGTPVKFSNPSNLTSKHGRNYGDVVEYTFIVYIPVNVCSTFGVFREIAEIRFNRTVPCLRRFKD